MMRCVMCGGQTLPPETAERPLDVGLPGAMIGGVRVHRCPDCGEEYDELPPAERLLSAVTFAVSRVGRRLNGAEIRFLRKRLGWSQRDFAEQFCVDNTTVSKWENEHIQMDEFKDKMLRLFAQQGPLLDDYGHDLDPTTHDAPFRIYLPNFEPPEIGVSVPTAALRSP